MTATLDREVPLTQAPAVSAVPARPAPNPDWNDKAACLDDPQPDRWVDLPPVRAHGTNNPEYDTHLETLARLCDKCPVKAHCLWDALDMNVRGVFAGTDEYDRADIRDLLNLPAPSRLILSESVDDDRLLDQQFQALRLARRGLSNKQIAALLGVSPMTVSRITTTDKGDAKRREKAHPST